MMDRALLAACGIALYGKEWVSPLAAALGISYRKFQRWRAGAEPADPETWGRLKRELRLLLYERRASLAEMRQEVDRLLGVL